MDTDDEGRNGGVGSVENGFAMLKILADKRRPMALSEVARELNISPGKVHRYFVSLIRCGAMSQQPTTGKYELGPLSLSIGLSALGQVDAVRFASEGLVELRDEIDLSVLLAVWSEVGPVVIRSEESSDRTKSNVVVGSILSVLTSAIGRVFLAYLPAVQTKNLLSVERRKSVLAAGLNAAEIIEDVRKTGISRIRSFGLPDVAVVGSPIFDSQNSVVAVVAVLGSKDAAEMKARGAGEKALKKFTAKVSHRLGHVAQDDSETQHPHSGSLR